MRALAARRDIRLLALAVVLGIAARLLYVLSVRHHALVGDEAEYDIEGVFFTHGRFLFSTAPYGIAHSSIWKTPGYSAWVGGLYTVLGHHQGRVEIVQAIVCGPATIVLTWLLGRRLVGPRAGLAAAFIVAVYPFAFQYEGLLYSEALATPLSVLLLLCFLRVSPTARRAALTGLLLGVLLLVRSSSLLFIPGITAAWLIAAGPRRGVALTGITLAVAALAIAPWTIRNHHVTGAWVPLSMQDAAAYGVFNADAARDPVSPWAWRPVPARDRALFSRAHPRSDAALRAELIRRARVYVSDHPAAVLGAFFWNGLSRLWDIRRPARALDEVHFEGRSRLATKIGLGMYWIMLPFALLGLWALRRWRAVVVPILLTALAASVVFTTDSGTRYRAPLEPLVVVLACGGAAALRTGWRSTRG